MLRSSGQERSSYRLGAGGWRAGRRNPPPRGVEGAPEDGALLERRRVRAPAVKYVVIWLAGCVCVCLLGGRVPAVWVVLRVLTRGFWGGEGRARAPSHDMA